MLIYRALSDAATTSDRVLDVGCGDGGHFPACGQTVGVDISLSDDMAVGHAYAAADGRQLPFTDDSFDYVVCNQVLEHVPEKGRLLDELARVCRPGGACYVSFPNRLWPVDHHSLPFGSSLLPRPVGRVVTRMLDSRSGYYRDHMFNLSPLRARRLLHDRFDSVEYTTSAYVRRYRDVYDDSRAGRLLQRLMPAVRACTSTRAGQWAFELAFPYSAYRCRV